jgi:hypothetical protein
MAYRLGKNRPVIDDRTMHFATYVKPALPSPPAAVSYGAKVASWPMYYNDQYGDCTCAAAGHMIQNWTANASAEVTVPPASVLTFYEHFVGTPPPPDKGCDMLSVLKYWRRDGIDGHKVLAFTSIDLQNRTQAQSACWLFGSMYIGVALPDFTVPPNVDPLTIPWVVPPGGPVGNAAPDQNNGHCIPAVSYDADNLYVVTWGRIKAMSWGFYNAYADESFAVISEDFIEANGLNPAGFDLTALEADLKAVTG